MFYFTSFNICDNQEQLMTMGGMQVNTLHANSGFGSSNVERAHRLWIRTSTAFRLGTFTVSADNPPFILEEGTKAV